MFVKMEIDYDWLVKNTWSGGKDTIDRLVELNLIEEFIYNVLPVIFDNDIPTDTELNDFLWFERDTINELLNREADDLFED